MKWHSKGLHVAKAFRKGPINASPFRASTMKDIVLVQASKKARSHNWYTFFSLRKQQCAFAVGSDLAEASLETRSDSSVHGCGKCLSVRLCCGARTESLKLQYVAGRVMSLRSWYGPSRICRTKREDGDRSFTRGHTLNLETGADPYCPGRFQNFIIADQARSD